MASGAITPKFLSGSTNGRGINVTATTPSGADTVHTTAAGTDQIEYLTIEAVNTHASTTVTLTIEFGGTGAGDAIIVKIAPQRGMAVVVDRLPLNNGLVVSAYASVSGVVNLFGGVSSVVL